MIQSNAVHPNDKFSMTMAPHCGVIPQSPGAVDYIKQQSVHWSNLKSPAGINLRTITIHLFLIIKSQLPQTHFDARQSHIWVMLYIKTVGVALTKEPSVSRQVSGQALNQSSG